MAALDEAQVSETLNDHRELPVAGDPVSPAGRRRARCRQARLRRRRTQGGAGASGGGELPGRSSPKHRERIAFDHDLQNLFPGLPSRVPPPFVLRRPVAEAPLSTAPIDDDLDVVVPSERLTYAILEIGIRPADDEAHSPWIVSSALCHAENSHEECGDELRHHRFRAGDLSFSTDRPRLRSPLMACDIS